MHVGLRFALRGAGCFGAGGLLAGAGQWLAFGQAAAGSPRPMPMLLGLAFAGGCVASALFGYRQCLSTRRLLPLAGFGLGFTLAAFVLMATLAGIHGGDGSSYLRTAVGLAAGFGLAGGFGGVCLDPGYLLPGLVMFALAGAFGGPLMLWMMLHASGLDWGQQGMMAAQAAGVALIFGLGGAGFGAFVR